MFPHFLAGYPFNCPLDSYVVLSLAGGAAPGHGYWVQPFGDGRTGYQQATVDSGGVLMAALLVDA
jgi:hypothetical protein